MTVKEDVQVKTNYKLVPPDGGYGYVILAAVSVNFISISMFAVCFGMIFNDFFIDLGMGATAVSLQTGICSLCVALSAFISGPLLKMLSRRKVAMIGSFFFNVGTFAIVFAKNHVQLIICQGVLQSFGVGFLYNACFTVLNDYFLTKRLFSVTLAQTLLAASSMVAPMVVSWSKLEYGYRGVLIITSAFGVQAFVASALLQPVEWHMKKEFVEDEPEKKLLLEMTQTDEFNNKALQTPVIKLIDIEKAENMFPEQKEKTKTSTVNVVIVWIKMILDWPLFKKYVFTCACLGQAAALFADYTYIFFLAQYFYDLKWDADQVKWAFALIGFGDIAARITLISFSTWFNKLGSFSLYLVGLLIAILTKLALLWVTDYTWALVIITIMGLSRCSVTVLLPLVISDTVKPEQFPSAMGISMLMFGLISIVMGPAVGAIRDATGNYTSMFLIFIALLFAVTIAWIAELLQRRKTKSIIPSK